MHHYEIIFHSYFLQYLLLIIYLNSTINWRPLMSITTTKTSSNSIYGDRENGNNVSKQCLSIIFLFSNILLCLLIIINALYQDPLYQLGVEFIKSYQQTESSWIWRFINNLFSLTCHPIGISILIFLSYTLTKRKILFFVHISYYFFVHYFMMLLKQSFQQYRPIWSNSEIEKWEWFCPSDYGNPSGHSFAVILLYQPVMSDFFGFRKRIGTLLYLLFCLGVLLSRTYLGVHSINQVLFGFSLGIIFLVLYKYYYQKLLYSIFFNLFTGKGKKIKIIIFIVHCLVCAIPVIFYKLNMMGKNEQVAIENLNKKCGVHITEQLIQNHMILSSVQHNFSFGVLYAFLFQSPISFYRNYYLGFWENKNRKSTIVSILLFFICGILPLQGFRFLGSHLTKKEVFLQYFFYSLGSLIFGFGLAYFPPIVAKNFELTKDCLTSKTNQDEKYQEMN